MSNEWQYNFNSWAQPRVGVVSILSDRLIGSRIYKRTQNRTWSDPRILLKKESHIAIPPVYMIRRDELLHGKPFMRIDSSRMLQIANA